MSFEPRIIESLDDLNQTRGGLIVEALSGIAGRGKQIIPNQVSHAQSFVIGVSDISEVGVDYRDWRFRTYLDGFSAMYHERWLPFERDRYFLERVYFHLFRENHRKLQEEEYILLHCDAGEPNDSDHSFYKRGPHLHISCAEQPIPHSHFALFANQLEDVLSSMDKLHEAMAVAIKMLDEQVLLPQVS